RHEALEGDYHGRDAALHVRGAAPEEQPVADLRIERVAQPRVRGPRRHHVRVPEEREHRAARAMGDPEVVHVAEAQVLRHEAQTRKALRDERLAAGGLRRHGRPADEFHGEVQRHPNTASSSPTRSRRSAMQLMLRWTLNGVMCAPRSWYRRRMARVSWLEITTRAPRDAAAAAAAARRSWSSQSNPPVW